MLLGFLALSILIGFCYLSCLCKHKRLGRQVSCFCFFSSFCLLFINLLLWSFFCFVYTFQFVFLLLVFLSFKCHNSNNNNNATSHCCVSFCCLPSSNFEINTFKKQKKKNNNKNNQQKWINPNIYNYKSQKRWWGCGKRKAVEQFIKRWQQCCQLAVKHNRFFELFIYFTSACFFTSFFLFIINSNKHFLTFLWK